MFTLKFQIHRGIFATKQTKQSPTKSTASLIQCLFILGKFPLQKSLKIESEVFIMKDKKACVTSNFSAKFPQN